MVCLLLVLPVHLILRQTSLSRFLLVLCLILGPRLGFGKTPMPPHSLVLCMIGTGMLWVGWYGFNVGSAFAADGIASNAFVATTMAAAVASQKSVDGPQMSQTRPPSAPEATSAGQRPREASGSIRIS